MLAGRDATLLGMLRQAAATDASRAAWLPVSSAPPARPLLSRPPVRDVDHLPAAAAHHLVSVHTRVCTALPSATRARDRAFASRHSHCLSVWLDMCLPMQQSTPSPARHACDAPDATPTETARHSQVASSSPSSDAVDRAAVSDQPRPGGCRRRAAAPPFMATDRDSRSTRVCPVWSRASECSCCRRRRLQAPVSSLLTSRGL